MGLLGPMDPQSNPIGNQQLLEKFGIEKFDAELNADVKRAKWVNSTLTSINRGESGPEDYPPVLPFDNYQIHFKVLTDQMKSPTFKDEMGMFQRRLFELVQRMQPPPPPLAPPGVEGEPPEASPPGEAPAGPPNPEPEQPQSNGAVPPQHSPAMA
jgi:hypothetical protein